MEYAKIGVLTLNTFDKDNMEARNFIKKLCGDESVKSRFQGITTGLLNNPKKEFFNHGFLVTHDNIFIGYIGIGAYNEIEKNVYLRAAIDKEKRGNSYGKILLSEITEYIFQNYPQVENICLKIANDNKASLMTASTCGYQWLKDDYYIKVNPYIEKSKIK